jgi:hypothetical protein
VHVTVNGRPVAGPTIHIVRSLVEISFFAMNDAVHERAPLTLCLPPRAHNTCTTMQIRFFRPITLDDNWESFVLSRINAPDIRARAVVSSNVQVTLRSEKLRIFFADVRANLSQCTTDDGPLQIGKQYVDNRVMCPPTSGSSTRLCLQAQPSHCPVPACCSIFP